MAHTSLLAALLLLVACALAPAQGSSCPEPYFLMGSSCVFITHDSGFSYTTYVDWDSARKRCAEKVAGTGWTADLVSNYDAAFQRLLTKHITAYSDLQNYHVYYVGAEFKKWAWRWLDGSPIDKMNYIWLTTAPTDFLIPTSRWMKGVLSQSKNPPSERLMLSMYPSYVPSPHYVCEARPAA